MRSLAVVVLVGATLASAWWTWRRTMREPRYLSNAALIGLTILLAGAAATTMGSPSFLGGAMVVLMVSPVLVVGLVVFLVINGAMMLRKEGRSLGNLLSLLSGLLLALAAAGCFAALSFDQRALPLALLVMMSGAWCALLLMGFMVYSWLYQRLVRQRAGNFVMVLGSGLIGERVPPLLAGRIDKGLDVRRQLLERGADPMVVMSGGQGSDELISEAEAMGRYAVDKGLDPARLLLENRSATTEQNLRFTGELVAQHLSDTPRGLAVTSDYHAMRAAMLARGLDLPIHVLGAPTARYFWPSAMLREFVAVLRGTWRRQVLFYLLLVTPLPVLMAYMVWCG